MSATITIGFFPSLFENSLKRITRWLPQQPHIETLIVPHQAAIQNPLQIATQVNTFLGGELDVEKMAAVVDPRLHREKITKTVIN